MKVVTFNTWGVNGPPERRPVLLRALRELDADLLLLQEATDGRLLIELGYPYLFTAAEGWLAIASRWPAERHGSVTYKTASPVETYRRQLLLAELQTPAGPLWAGCTHLSWKAEDGATRLAQAEELARWVSELPGPLLIGGDFNAPPEDPPVARMREAGFIDLYAQLHPGDPGITWDNRNPFIQSHSIRFPDRRIDYLFMRHEVPDTGKGSPDSSQGERPLRFMQLVSCEAVCNAPGEGGFHPSDHYGVLAVLERK